MSKEVLKSATVPEQIAAGASALSGLGANAKLSQLKAYTQEPTKDTPLREYYGPKVSDTDSNLQAGNRGPTLLEDIHFRSKVSHFDHERIPERVVHARGAAAHGEFKLHTPLSDVTTAGVLTDTSRTTPVFLRFSTVVGSRGSADTVRDVRGFALRFYTEEGNWDIVGNDIPVFFIQHAIKFPDIIHAVKPEPDNEIPQAQTAHDNAWDFMGLTTESTHMQLWHLSDRGIPRSFRMVQGFGVNTFKLVDKHGKGTFVKFHFTPHLGVHSLVWDEALKLAGQDPDFHRRDLWDAIEAGAFPKWEFGVQLLKEEDEHKFDFDILDATKIWPEEDVPIKYIGTLTLNRNPENFFAETEQVAYCTQHIVPGIDFSNDPLLQGRNFSYFDTQLIRLGGPNFGDIPINQPICPVMNNLRDGYHQHRIRAGKANYWPNRWGATHPTPVKEGGFGFEKRPVEGWRERARGPKFAEHYNQATLFWNSMSDVEKQHIIDAASFELGKCGDGTVIHRVVDNLNIVDNGLASAVAVNVGLQPPKAVRENHGKKSAFLSQVNGKFQKFTPAGRKVGVMLFDGFDIKSTEVIISKLKAEGVMVMIVGPRKGLVVSGQTSHQTQFTIETSRSTHFDALVFPGGDESYAQALRSGRVIHFAREAFAHFKAMGATGNAVKWLDSIALPQSLKAASTDSITVDAGVVTAGSISNDFADKFLDGVAQHRAWGRDVSLVAA